MYRSGRCDPYWTGGTWTQSEDGEKQLRSARCQYSCFVDWERVLTIDDFLDVPRRGIAEVSGQPHIYESPFNSAKDDFEEFFWVQPIDPDLLAVMLEGWAIWNRWRDAFDHGEASQEIYPTLPQDRTRHDQIKRLIGSQLKTEPALRRKLWARFRSLGPGSSGMEVKWLESEPTRE